MTGSRLLVVTGGSRGIGRRIALTALDAGWNVAISYGRSKKPAEEMVADWGGRMQAFPLDVADPGSVQRFFEEVSEAMAVPRALVASAGVDLGPRPIAEIDHGFVHTTMAVNAVGLILCCREFARRAIAEKSGGVIVNISSMASTIGGRANKTVYAASKGAVDVFTIGAAKELAPHGISVFAVRPGVTRTDMTSTRLSDPKTKTEIEGTIAAGTVAEPEDIAVPVVDLISGRFDYASGSLLNLSGGGFVV